MKGGVAFGLLFFIAIVLVIAGFQGAMGRVLGVVFTPGRIIDRTNNQESGSAIGSDFGQQVDYGI